MWIVLSHREDTLCFLANEFEAKWRSEKMPEAANFTVDKVTSK